MKLLEQFFFENDDSDFPNLYSDTLTYLIDRAQPLDMFVLSLQYINMIRCVHLIGSVNFEPNFPKSNYNFTLTDKQTKILNFNY